MSNNKMEKSLSNTRINCLITISATPLGNPYKQRICENLDPARFI